MEKEPMGEADRGGELERSEKELIGEVGLDWGSEIELGERREGDTLGCCKLCGCMQSS